MVWMVSQVAIGGALGATGRYLAGRSAARLFGPDTVLGTLAVNILGSFLIGVAVVAFAHFDGHRQAPFLVTGVLGAFTTFSTFSLDTARLVESGMTSIAVAYVLGTVAMSLAGVALGLWAARGVLT